MAVYELMVIVPTDGEVSGVGEVTPLLTKLAKKVGGKISLKEEMGEKAFAYKMQKYDRGIYYIFEVEIQEAKVKEFNKQLKIQKPIIRYLLIKKRIVN